MYLFLFRFLIFLTCSNGYGKQVPLSFEVTSEVFDAVITDEEWLWQMLLNLLTNACKYTDKGSIKVAVSLRRGCIGMLGGDGDQAGGGGCHGETRCSNIGSTYNPDANFNTNSASSSLSASFSSNASGRSSSPKHASASPRRLSSSSASFQQRSTPVPSPAPSPHSSQKTQHTKALQMQMQLQLCLEPVQVLFEVIDTGM